LAPAIALAEKGYSLNFYETALIADSAKVLKANATAAKTFFKPDGALYMPGDQFSRPLLAKTLKEISKRGRDGFYKGWVADAIADDMAANGGLITREDLANYEPVEREALSGTYRGYGIVGFPPPSSGGALLIQMLNMLEARPPMSRGDTASELHYLIEVMRRAYADRAELMGDTDFVDVPVEGLIDKAYATTRAATIDESRASQSSDIREGAPPAHESTHTTHFSVIDAEGNMVANTYTLNLGFGSGVVIPGTGIVMNNEMDDFAALVGMPNAYGLVMGERNAIEAGKRPLSSMTPTLILKDGAPFLALGAQGGSRIISAVLNTTLNVIDREMNLGEAIAQPRVHQQWLPDTVLFEEGMSADTTSALEKLGHDVEPFDWQATIHGVMVKDGWYYGYSDPRIPGGAACAPDSGC
jgi:gamma-glutamyltranspeptidase/glutathione hydrolase